MSPVQAPERPAPAPLPAPAVETGSSPHPLSPFVVAAVLAGLIALVWALAWTAVL